MALSTTQIQQLYTAYLGRPADRAGLDYWQEQDVSLAQLRDSLANDAQPEYVELYGDRTRAELVEAIYQNMFGRAADTDGLEYWVNGEGSAVPASQLQQLFIEAASAADSIAFDDRVEADVAQIPPPIGDGEPGVKGETYNLTDGRDNFTGTDDNDTFIGTVGQNQNGAVSNAFATGDVLDGGAGTDKIEATMINDNEVDDGTAQNPRPNTTNIEQVYIEALENVTLDATRMENVEQYWADFGRGSMTFDNVSLQGDNLSITKDVTFGIRDTQFDTNFTANFDSQSLTREAASQVNSSLLVRIADVSTETPTTPLANVDLNLSFDLGGETVTLEGVRSTDGTYPGLALALRNALEEAGYGDVNVNLSTPYSEVTVAGNTVTLPFTAQEILLTDPAGNAFSNVNFTQAAIESVADGFLVAGNAQPQDPSSTSSLIESNLVLDNAGRGSIAGDVVIGGGSNSELGVEQFNVSVDRSSKIESLNTTEDKLQNIVISSIGAAGSLYIGATQADLTEIDANAFEGAELSLGEGTVVSDLVNLDAGGTSADVTFVADYDGAGRASDAQSFVINTGSGSDTITADLTGTSTSGSTQAGLTINAGAGNNVITLTSTDAEVNEATVVTAGGADTVTGGATHLTAETGAGNDTIYAENTGNKAVAQLDAGAFATATVAVPSVTFAQLLSGREVRVTVAMPEEAPVVGADSFTDGYEVTADIEASNGDLTTERDLYEAAARAINNDPVVNKLVKASVDSNGNLKVEYLVDGTTAFGDDLVQVEVLGEWADLSTGEQNNIISAVQAASSNSGITAANIATAYDEADAPIVFAEQVADTGTLAEFTVNLGALDQTSTSIDVTIGGTTETVTVPGPNTNLAADFAGETVTIDGVTYTFAQVGTTSEVTLTAGSAGVVDGGVSVTDSVTTVNGTQTVEGTSTLGTDSVTNGVNTVNAGAGDDVIVLSSNDDVNDTVVFDAGGFGNDTIVHFNDAANGDVLDFTAWLNNVTSASGSTDSEQRVATTFVANNAIDENSVTVADFDDLNIAGTVTFDSVTNAQVLEALNTNASFGNVAADATLEGNVQKSIVMIQNVDGTDANLGEYKVYEVTSETAAGTDNFTAATLVGTVDFGDQLAGTFDATNLA